jgi:hypothetical protein
MDKSRLRRAIGPASLLMLILLFIHTCVPKALTDLKLVAVQRIPADLLPRSDDLRVTLSRRGETLLKISLSGSAHWIEQVRRHELNGYANVVRCDDPDRMVFNLGVYSGEVPVSYYGEGFSGYHPFAPTLVYDIYVPATGRYGSVADPNAHGPDYDLTRERMTLCLRIAGGAMHGAYGRSNEVRVDLGGQR